MGTEGPSGEETGSGVVTLSVTPSEKGGHEGSLGKEGRLDPSGPTSIGPVR